MIRAPFSLCAMHCSINTTLHSQRSVGFVWSGAFIYMVEDRKHEKKNKGNYPFHSDCWGIVAAVTTRFSIADSIHLVVFERIEWEWEIVEWFRMVLYLTLSILNDRTNCSIEERVGVNLDKSSTVSMDTGVKCWSGKQCWSWMWREHEREWSSLLLELVRYDLELKSTIQLPLNLHKSGNK